MLCRRLNKIIYTRSSVNHSSQYRCPVTNRSKCSWINSVLSALKTDPMSSLRLRIILRDLRVTRLWNAWSRTQLVSFVVKRCRRDRGVRDMLACFRQTILRPSRTFLLSATAAYKSNSGDDDDPTPCQRNISDEELEALIQDLDGVDELSRATLFCEGCSHRLVIDKRHPGVLYCTCDDTHPPGASEDGWIPYMEAEDVVIWRKEYKPGGLFAYKVYGRYKDLHASDFATIQVDGAYRRQWDDAVADLSVVERPANGVASQAVLHWEVAWPRLFSNRDYVYIRRHKLFAVKTKCLPHKEAIFRPDEPEPCRTEERPSVHSNAKRKAMENERREARETGQAKVNNVYVILSRSCTHPAAPERRHAIRVQEYWSNMVVRNIDGADNLGMEFVLTYYDEPSVGGLPSGVSAWATGRAAPAFLARMHRAAAGYQQWLARHGEV
ncbi:stAR-related lipid transfer protein 7, mitochondrial-like [Choristoneura fumiferana]|uniref:stAR-related lipid transfer protein 7, mitochondrial-like n=1 Tax=Choristoneura fumiferana TaxID=7141 RepID=UPI003D159347